MQFMVFLNRFEQDKNNLEKKFNNMGVKIVSEEDDKLIVEGFPEQLLKLQEVARIIKIVTEWKALDFRKLKEDSLKAMKIASSKEYRIQTKFYQKIKISASSVYKHINPYLKHEGFVFSEEGTMLFVEFMKENNEIFYRISYALPEWYYPSNAIELQYNFSVVIENPVLVEEVSDFLRLCWIFKMPLFIVTKNKEFSRILEKAKEITKGIDYSKMKLNITERLPSGFVFAGFSKVARENEIELKKFLLNENKKIAFVFGDDKFGLSQEMRDSMDYMFRLTPELKKPLRASHALSYVLGLYSSEKI